MTARETLERLESSEPSLYYGDDGEPMLKAQSSKVDATGTKGPDNGADGNDVTTIHHDEAYGYHMADGSDVLPKANDEGPGVLSETTRMGAELLA